MRAFENWDSIQEAGDFESPVPGAYIARIIRVEDVEDKQYLRVEWDFDEGAYEGENAAAAARLGFWPIALIRSYKDSAAGFFKAFIAAVESSNRGYRFNPRQPDPAGLEGCRMGVILGEEEYAKKNGEIGKRLYVHQVRSLDAIQEGEFKIPDLKRLPKTSRAVGRPAPAATWAENEDDGDLPF